MNNLDRKSLNEVLIQANDNYAQIIYEVDADTTFVCEARTNGETITEDDSVWRIKKIVKVGTTVKSSYPNNDDRFIFIPSQKDTYNYLS